MDKDRSWTTTTLRCHACKARHDATAKITEAAGLYVLVEEESG